MSQSSNLWVSPQNLDTAHVEGDNPQQQNDHQTGDLITLLCRSLSVLWKDWPKQMECRILDNSNHKFSLIGKCPHRPHDSVFIQVTSVYGFRNHMYCAAMECQGCRGLILGIVQRHSGSDWRYINHYPLGAPDDSVPEEVAAANPIIAMDFAEALRCFWVKSYKASVAMCRRSVEATCKHLGATGKTLEKKIDSLAAQGKITESLKEMAHAVRLSGNRGLHGKKTTTAEPGDQESPLDDLDLFGEDEANAMIAFTKELFHHVFVMPALLEKYKPKPKGEASDVS